jgi:L-iditol 2-dehydrogenase
MGHEWTGDIVEVGENVQGFHRGMRIAMVLYGGYTEYVKITPDEIRWGKRQRDRVVELPDGVSYEEGTFMEPFADCIHSVEQAQVRLGDTLAVIGSGQMGLQHCIVAKLMGLKVIAIDLIEDRLEMAKKAGADFVINGKDEHPVAKVKELTDGKGADGVCVTIGAAQAVEQALELVKKTGSIALFGGFKRGTTVTFDPNLIHYGELVLTGAYGVGLKGQKVGLYKSSLELIAAGKAQVGQLITHRFPLEELETALKMVGSYEALKAVIQVK